MTTLLVYSLGVLGHFTPRVYLSFGVLEHSGLKTWTRTTFKIHNKFELYQVFVYNFMCQNVVHFPIYVLFTKIKNNCNIFCAKLF